MNGTACGTITFDLFMTLQDITCVQECLRVMVFHLGNCLNSVVVARHFASSSLFAKFILSRPIFVVVITFFEFVILCQCFLELAVIINQDHLACQTFVLLVSVSYSFVLLILSQSILNSYLEILDDETKLLSIWDFVLLLTINCALIFVIHSSPLWTSYQPMSSCAVDFDLIIRTFIWDIFLSIVCISFYITIFMESHRTSCRSPKLRRNLLLRYWPSLPTSVLVILNLQFYRVESKLPWGEIELYFAQVGVSSAQFS